jgi:hypothetical protein
MAKLGDLVRDRWPLLLIVYAMLLLLRATDARAAIALTALAVGAASIGFVGITRVPWAALGNMLLVTVAVGGVAVVATSTSAASKHTSLLWARRLSSEGPLAPRTDLLCVLGGLTYDLRRAHISGNETLRIHLVAGEVVLLVPADWHCELSVANLVLTRLTEVGQEKAGGPNLRLAVTARAAGIFVRRY